MATCARKESRGANAEALIDYRRAVLKAAEDVENALALLSETEALTRARDLSQEAYRAGSITLTDVLDADRQLLTAQRGI